MNHYRLLASLTVLLLSGCETTDKTLSTAERMFRSKVVTFRKQFTASAERAP